MLLLGCLGENEIKTICNSCFNAISCLLEVLVPSCHYTMGRYLSGMPDTQELPLMGSTKTPSPGRALEREIEARKKNSGRRVVSLASKFS